MQQTQETELYKLHMNQTTENFNKVTENDSQGKVGKSDEVCVSRAATDHRRQQKRWVKKAEEKVLGDNAISIKLIRHDYDINKWVSMFSASCHKATINLTQRMSHLGPLCFTFI